MSSTGQAASSTSNFQVIITAALNDYEKTTGTKLSENPFAAKLGESNSSEAILGLLQDREEAFKKYRNDNRGLISCLSPVVKALHALSGIVGEAASLVPFPPAKAVFTSIDVLLAAAIGVTSSYDALLELFECLGSFLMRLEIYVKIPPTTMMTNVVVRIMVQVLSVLALATKLIKERRLKKYFKKLLGESEVEDALQNLDRLTADEARMTVAQTLGVVYSLVGNVREVMEYGKASTDSIQQASASLLSEMNRMKRDQLQKDVQRWLSPPDPSTNHDFVWKAHHNGSASWFFKSGVLTEWKRTGSFLWIHGNPGSGKSTLLSVIIQDIRTMCLHAAGLATMAYYYFDFRDVKKQDCYGLLSSLVSQLSAELDSCHKILSQLYSDHAGGMRMPTTGALTKCIKDMLSLPVQGPIYVIVDGLDECPDASGNPSAREEVLGLVEELGGLKLSNLHLCVASRPLIDIRNTLKPLNPLQISLHDESGQKDDIIEYINSVVHSDRKMQSWRNEDKELVVEVLSEKAGGMFRWVDCQFDRLRRSFPDDIPEVLANLPDGLDETYKRILLEIDEGKRKYALRLLQCLLVSTRPLRVEELVDILAVRFNATGAPSLNRGLQPLDAEEVVSSACSSLIAIVNKEGAQIAQFSHFSVKEYLTSKELAKAEERLSYYHILPEPAHAILAHICLCVLLHLDDKIDRNAMGRFPLRISPYAARHWVNHAQFGKVSAHTGIQQVMKHLFDPARPHFAAWVWLHNIDRHWIEPMSTIHPTRPEAGPLYFASLCGFHDLVEHLIAAHPQDVNSRGGSHTTPLHAASVKGHLSVASLLLKNGAGPNSRDDRGRTPLHRVSQGGQLLIAKPSLEITQLLMNSGADLNATDNEGWTPLHAVARSGCCDIADLLLGSGASLDVRNNDQETPLHVACGNGKLDVSRFLIDRGSNKNLQGRFGFIPLHTASQNGHLDIVQLLLDCGSDVNAREIRSWTPLHFASGYGHLRLARFLIDRSADVNAYTGHGRTPMHIASANGYFEIVELLVERGAVVDSRNDNEETPLDHAARNGFLDIVRLLIKSRAAVSAQDNNGSTPFHSASKYGHLHIAKYLLECGVAVDVRNGSDETSLYLASSSGKVEVVRFLIEHGADIYAEDNKGWNPLHIASQNGHLDVVRMLINTGVAVDIRNGTQMTPLALASSEGKVEAGRFLIERGADVNVRDNEGWTPLHFASRHGHLDMARLLLNHGDHEAKINITDGNGWTPLHSASYGGHLEVVKLLLGRSADVDLLNKANKTAAKLASENDKAKVAKFIADYKADANIRNKIRSFALDTAQYGADEDEGNASLHAAAEEGNINVVKSLLERGVDANTRDEYNRTPLDLAATKGKVNVVRLLIEQGAKVDLRDHRDWTPLHKASRDGHLEVSRVLVDHNANVNARTRGQWTPIHLSAYNGKLEVVKLLLARGVDVHAVNCDGQTPYQLSLASGHRVITNLLREHGAGGASP